MLRVAFLRHSHTVAGTMTGGTWEPLGCEGEVHAVPLGRVVCGENTGVSLQSL